MYPKFRRIDSEGSHGRCFIEASRVQRQVEADCVWSIADMICPTRSTMVKVLSKNRSIQI